MARAVERAIERAALPRRRGRHRHRQDARLPRPGGALRPARDRLHRDEDPAGADLAEGHPAARASACGLEFAAAYLKGRSNYFCLARGEEFARAPTFAAREEAALWPRIEAWARTTETGDRSEIDLPDQFHTWKDLSATSETCAGRECERYEELLRHPGARARRRRRTCCS